MAGKTVSFNTHCNLSESQLENVARWLSCNGEAWGMGPTAVFASAAALFLFNELQATIFVAGDHAHVSLLERTLVFSMVLGMLALMVHLWVCSMRFFQYYLDTLIRDSPNILLEMTTAGFLGKSDLVPLGPLTRFLKQQQPQIHITICWFLSLCYADYVRKHYCTRFNMPYLEQWQAELHARASRGVHQTIQKVNSFVGAVHTRLRGYTQTPADADTHTSGLGSTASMEGSGAGSRVSFAYCARAASDPALRQALRRELSARLVSSASETTAQILDQLRAYVTKTRCPCSDPPQSSDSGVSAANAATGSFAGTTLEKRAL
ncbi:uncharacterized protein LOC111001281 [Pieris rapae]|uniref:uncharacterized protein LOC111001281 n=1 Tax=Pieris rapae TaxID=64459 RepID=UPI001E27B2A3|nr:uncharacterized protein LOC111001281 [Pieris rapae]